MPQAKPRAQRPRSMQAGCTITGKMAYASPPLFLLLCAVCLRAGAALDLSDELPPKLLEMVCWEEAPCHTVYTDQVHDILYFDLLASYPGATIRDVLAECDICNMTGKEKSCYRTASMIDFDFSINLTQIGRDLFDLEPSGCGETQSYCWHNISCATQTDAFLEELQRNVYASPTMSLDCAECDAGGHNVSCITGVCMSCFFPDNPLRMMWEGLDAFGDNVGGHSCEEVVSILEEPVGISAARPGVCIPGVAWPCWVAMGIALTAAILTGFSIPICGGRLCCLLVFLIAICPAAPEVVSIG